MMLDLQISSEENHSHHPKNPAGLGYSAFRCALDLVRGEGGDGVGHVEVNLPLPKKKGGYNIYICIGSNPHPVANEGLGWVSRTQKCFILLVVTSQQHPGKGRHTQVIYDQFLENARGKATKTKATKTPKYIFHRPYFLASAYRCLPRVSHGGPKQEWQAENSNLPWKREKYHETI